MTDALIGSSGFVGTSLLRQRSFDETFRSTNIAEINEKKFDVTVCAGASAQKWLANKDPEYDRQKIGSLMSHLEKIESNLFILISTVDVFREPRNVNEDSPVSERELQAYGLHRLRLETFVATTFPRYLIVRLPGLVGPTLRKNVIFDLLNENNLESIDSRSIYQFYPIANLWSDIEIAVNANLKLVHLTAEPISVADISTKGFGKPFKRTLPCDAPSYDFRTKYADLFGGSGNYQYRARESILSIRTFAQSEPLSSNLKQGNTR